jgi:hypothetical protein
MSNYYAIQFNPGTGEVESIEDLSILPGDMELKPNNGLNEVLMAYDDDDGDVVIDIKSYLVVGDDTVYIETEEKLPYDVLDMEVDNLIVDGV